MGLIKCPDCGKEISDRAKVCINCGAPIEKTSDESRDKSHIIIRSSKKTLGPLVFYVIYLDGQKVKKMKHAETYDFYIEKDVELTVKLSGAYAKKCSTIIKLGGEQKYSLTYVRRFLTCKIVAEKVDSYVDSSDF